MDLQNSRQQDQRSKSQQISQRHHSTVSSAATPATHSTSQDAETAQRPATTTSTTLNNNSAVAPHLHSNQQSNMAPNGAAVVATARPPPISGGSRCSVPARAVPIATHAQRRRPSRLVFAVPSFRQAQSELQDMVRGVLESEPGIVKIALQIGNHMASASTAGGPEVAATRCRRTNFVKQAAVSHGLDFVDLESECRAIIARSRANKQDAGDSPTHQAVVAEVVERVGQRASASGRRMLLFATLHRVLGPLAAAQIHCLAHMDTRPVHATRRPVIVVAVHGSESGPLKRTSTDAEHGGRNRRFTLPRMANGLSETVLREVRTKLQGLLHQDSTKVLFVTQDRRAPRGQHGRPCASAHAVQRSSGGGGGGGGSGHVLGGKKYLLPLKKGLHQYVSASDEDTEDEGDSPKTVLQSPTSAPDVPESPTSQSAQANQENSADSVRVSAPVPAVATARAVTTSRASAAESDTATPATSATASTAAASEATGGELPPEKRRRKSKWQKPEMQPIMRAAIWELRFGKSRIVETSQRYRIPLRTLRRYRDISAAGGHGFESVDGKGVQFDESGMPDRIPLPPRTVCQYRRGFTYHQFEEDNTDASHQLRFATAPMAGQAPFLAGFPGLAAGMPFGGMMPQVSSDNAGRTPAEQRAFLAGWHACFATVQQSMWQAAAAAAVSAPASAAGHGPTVPSFAQPLRQGPANTAPK